ncbi:hypothetical protein [Halobacillus massiliensis]|uniref:hypothetical protein n=1 Tax=Halobacillus massiliensis TaxID=1926286 RepID=UPI0015C4D246|nr:hypothetical protein [Halobacillus massiliensis]
MESKLDANRIIDIQASRYAQKMAVLEKEVSILIGERDQLKEENQQLKDNKANAKK